MRGSIEAPTSSVDGTDIGRQYHGALFARRLEDGHPALHLQEWTAYFIALLLGLDEVIEVARFFTPRTAELPPNPER